MAMSLERKQIQFGIRITLPAIIVILIVTLFPLLYSFLMSVMEWKLTADERSFTGLQNYVDVFSNSTFLGSIGRNFLFGVIVLSIELFLGFFAAFILDKTTFASRWARLLFLVPYFTTKVVAGFNFRWMFNAQTGIVNLLLRSIGLSNVNWLAEPVPAFVVICIADIWIFTPFVTIILLAGIKGIPEELEQVAAVDGASSFQYIRHVVLPLLLPSVLLASILRVIDVFRVFDVPYIMTGGGPGEATLLLPMHVYETAFYTFNFGRASAQSYVILALSLGICILLVRGGGVFKYD